MKQRLLFSLIMLLFIAAAFLVAKNFLHSRSDRDVPIKSMDSWQQADASLGYPLDPQKPNELPKLDPRLIQLSAFERAVIPTTTRMSYPMGSEHGALSYNAQVFWENNLKRGGHHLGDDFNGIGGMNTDLGDPIYSIADGLVVYRGEPSPGWGNTVMVAHRIPTGSIQLTMYAHLDEMHTAIGSVIPRGSILGTVGNAGNRYPAHLHMELHESSGIHIGSGYQDLPGDRIDPTKVIESHQKQGPEHFSPSILGLALSKQLELKKNLILIQTPDIKNK